MANSKDYYLPNFDLKTGIPKNLQNPVNAALMDTLFNRFLTSDEAVPLYGYIGRPPSDPDDKTPKIPQQNVERDINALIPVFSFKTGTEVHSFTAQDLIRKAEVLGISTNKAQWLYSQGNNYSPPISLQKFTNFYNFYWVANAVPNPPSFSWNPDNDPEYYSIQRPSVSDADKLNVKVSTNAPIVLTGSGFNEPVWELLFSGPVTATLRPIGPGFPSTAVLNISLTGDNEFNKEVSFVYQGKELIRFNILRDTFFDAEGNIAGRESFAAGDKFSITSPFISRTSSVQFNGSSGVKGKITGVRALQDYQVINGVMIRQNDRVLVKDMGDQSQNGVYVVMPGNWIRAEDMLVLSNGQRVFDSETQTLYQGDGTGKFVPVPGASNTNDWQESNFWRSKEEVQALGLDASKVVQATRPIIEFLSGIELNSFVKDGLPANEGTAYTQRKTEFNQAPLFNLYRYDGTHAGVISTLFFYVQDPTAEIDVQLQRRVKHSTNASADFLFGHGMLDGNSLLFYKQNNELKTIWEPGYTQPHFDIQKDLSRPAFGNGNIHIEVLDPFISQQIFTLTYLNSGTFELVGSKNKVFPDHLKFVHVGIPYENDLLAIEIQDGSIPFQAGDVFTFRIGNFENTRYVYRDETNQIFDLYGGEASDFEHVGTWQVPRMFYHNIGADNGQELPEGTLYSHFRGIIANQLSGLPEDRAFGGSIKLWSEQQNLLASLLMQRDLTVPSIIELAQRQYETGINAVNEIFLKNYLEYISKFGAVQTEADEVQLLDYILSIRKNDHDVRKVLYDSTSPVTGFPATLPQLGVIPLVKPGIIFDPELGATLLRRHDGSLSPLNADSTEFRDRLFSTVSTVKRSDGKETLAVSSFTDVPNPKPYKGELWILPTFYTDIRVFDVLSDEATAPVNAKNGDFWYNRSADIFYEYVQGFWVPGNILDAWVVTNPAEILNDLQLMVENKLYNGMSAMQRSYFSAEEIDQALSGKLKQELKRELNTWAASNNYDAFAPDYNAADAFTWNYSSSPKVNFAALTGNVPARWFNVLKNHQATVSTEAAQIISTARPHLEPWKLLGLTGTSAAAFRSQWVNKVRQNDVEDSRNGYEIGTIARAVKFTVQPVVTTLQGLPVIDGVQLSSGDKLLLASESSIANNGVWLVSSGAWTKLNTPNKSVVSIQEGIARSSTHWVVLSTGEVNQVREWKEQMWSEIHAARPGLKLSVDIARDALLPPYVNPALPYSINALSTAMPLNITKRYEFGESSPVETVWKKSVEFRYSLAKALFRYDPLGFLGHCWGIEWVKAGESDILYDGFDITVPGHTRFRLHGENILPKSRVLDASLLPNVSFTGPSDINLSIVREGFTADRKHSFTIKTETGLILGYATQGEEANISANGYSINNLLIKDNGVPFRVQDRFDVSANADGSGRNIVFVPANTAVFNGFGQTFTQALREGNFDSTNGYAIQAYRNWSVNLGYRAGGLVSTDDLSVFTDLEPLPNSAFDLRFKRSSYTKDLWAQALRIQVSQFGKSTVNQYGLTTALGRAEDWIFRIEGYNTRFLDIEYYTYDKSADYVTFNALDQTHDSQEWRQYEHISGLVKTQLPFTITGLDNVVNFIFGYAKRLEALGWKFNDDGISNMDAETNRIRGWQLEVEKLIDRAYAGLELGQGHVVNPFMDRIWVDQPVGLLSKFTDTSLFDVQAHAGVFDMLGNKINAEELNIIRNREKSEISALVPMFSVHAQIDEFEHLFVFNNLASPSTGEGLIYDPFSGARIVTIKMKGRRQASSTLRPEFGGHYLVGNEVKRNLKSSTDKIAGYYDTDKVFEDELSTRHALALLGFSPKTYMSDLDLSERTQFNFWRGLVQMKGTNASIDAFLNNERFKNAQIDEYWAYKVAEFGDARSKVYPELRLNTNDTLQQFTKLQFDADEVPGGANPPLIDFQQIYSDDEERWFSIDDLNQETRFAAEVVGNYHKIGATIGELYTLPFIADKLVGTGFVKINARTIKSTAQVISITGYGPASPRFNPVKLFNYIDKELVEEISIWHPAAGQHTTSGISSINITSNNDPARYNISTLVAGNSNYDPLRTWGAKELGRVWWDTTELSYIPYYDSTIFSTVDERLSRWGSQTDYSVVNVAEWVESTVPPALYNAQASIDAGNADLDPNTRADGEVHGAKTYVREREWSTRPIAWSKAGVATASAHPSFNGSYFDTLYFLNNQDKLNVSLESTTFAQLGITPGMRIGAWQQPDTLRPGYATRPLSEYLVLDAFTKSFTGINFPVSFNSAGLSGSIAISTHVHTPVVGDLLFTAPALVSSEVLNADGSSTGLYDVSSFLEVRAVDSKVSDLVLIRTDRAMGSHAEPATSGYQEVEFSAIKTGESNTGLTDLVQYNLTVTQNNVPTPIQVYGELNKTFSQLVSSINAVLTTAYVELIDGSLVFNTLQAGLGNTITVQGDLLTSLYDFKRILPTVPGKAAKAAISPISTATFNAQAGDSFSFILPNIGSELTVSITSNGVYGTRSISLAIANSLQGFVNVKDAVQVTEISPLSDPDYAISNPSVLPGLANDPADGEYEDHAGIGWRAWTVPTQAELNADSKAPDSIWKAYLGEWVHINPSSSVISNTVPDLIQDSTVLARYNSTWSNWVELKTVQLKKTAELAGNVSFVLPENSTADRVSVYVNGVARLIGTYQIIGSSMVVQNVQPGSEVVILIRAYSPSIEELEFNPATVDDISVQRQYKVDYQYVEMPIRDNNGAILSTKYYFWVKNRSTQARKKPLSVKAVSALLSEGPSQFVTFQNLSSEFTYDAITIAGLSYVVTKDDTFKLRFTRNFTLRDDPQELDLKDTHTEWALIRPNQRTKIPEQLWEKVVNAACGEDAAGNILPSPRRAAYDARHGTKTQFGFSSDQILAPTEMVKETLLFIILNTKLVLESSNGTVPDYMTFLNFNDADIWFSTATSTRSILTTIWNEARANQVNELFFAVLEDIVASNMELSDIFKTSRLNAYSTTIVKTVPVTQQFE